MRKADWKRTESLDEVQEEKEGRHCCCLSEQGQEKSVWASHGPSSRFSGTATAHSGARTLSRLELFLLLAWGSTNRQHLQPDHGCTSPPLTTWPRTSDIHVCNSFHRNKFCRWSFCSKPMDSASTILKCSFFFSKGPSQLDFSTGFI